MGPTSVRLVAVHCHSLAALIHSVAFNETARLMHLFINVQGQMLHLVQADTRLLNYFDNLIALYCQGPMPRAARGSTRFRRAWSCFETGNLHQGLTLALLMSRTKCHKLIKSCILSLQPSNIWLTSCVVTSHTVDRLSMAFCCTSQWKRRLFCNRVIL